MENAITLALRSDAIDSLYISTLIAIIRDIASLKARLIFFPALSQEYREDKHSSDAGFPTSPIPMDH